MGEIERWQTPNGRTMVTSVEQRQAFPGRARWLCRQKLPTMCGSPSLRLICGSWEALDSINRRDLVTAGITGLNRFLVLGPFSASWPCDHKERGSLQERTYCSANTSTMNLPDPQFFSQRNLSIWPVCLDGRTKEITRPFRIEWKLTPV